MKNFFCFLLILFVAKTANAQYDTIVMVTGQKLPAIVKEVSDSYVKYKHPLDSLGPMLVIKKKLVEKFIMRNGCLDMKVMGYDNCVKDPTFGVLKNDEFKRTIVSVDLAQAIISHFQFTIEHVLKKRTVAFVALGNIGTQDPAYKSTFERKEVKVNPISNNVGYYYKKFYYGAQIKLYPSSHKKATYFISFGVDVGKAVTQIERNDVVYTYHPYYGYQTGYYISNVTQKYESVFQSFTFTNGGVFRPKKNIVFQILGFVGVNRFIDPPPPSYMVQPKEQHVTFFVRYGIGLSAGFAF